MVGWVIWEQIDGKNDPKRQQPVDKERTVNKVYKYRNRL
jgi:hypothetical protein